MLKKFRLLFAFAFAALLVAAPMLRAEEGMWTLDNVPLKKLMEKYHFKPTQEWLDHIRLASVRINDGGSASFISPDGLLLTNHHVARGQLQKNSTADHDYIKNGFLAMTQADEMKSPDLEINVLVGMQNVTDRVQGAAKGIKDPAAAIKAREAAIAEITKESKDKTGNRSDIVSLYNGGEYWLYVYKVYTDVRIVFAPEEEAAFFGGDPDNFTYPRYDTDMAIFRVYENGKPIHCENYLKWSAKGADPGDLVFVSGHPGSTERDQTLAQLMLTRDVVTPNVIEYLSRRIAAAQDFARQGPEQARLVNTLIFGLQNSLKVYLGRRVALADKTIIEKKTADENDFKARIKANPEWQKEYGDAWETIAKGEELIRPEVKAQVFRRTDSRLLSLALTLVQYSAEIKKPDAERLAQFHDANLEGLKFQLASPAPVSTVLEKLYMTVALNLAVEKLGKNDVYVAAVLNGDDVPTAINKLVDGSKIADPAFRKSLMDGGPEAIAASTDPMIVAARRLDPVVREFNKRMRDTVSSILTPAGEKLGKARFLAYGHDMYPDATFTLRLSYGSVGGMEYFNGRDKEPQIVGYEYNGTIAPPFTTFYGLYDRAASFGNRFPFKLTEKQEAARNTVNLSTPINFVTNNDIIGGNSGSPVVNKDGELVGLVFDGNIESLAGDFVFDGTKNRTVAVHSAGMLEAMRKIYHADALANEIEGKK